MRTGPGFRPHLRGENGRDTPETKETSHENENLDDKNLPAFRDRRSGGHGRIFVRSPGARRHARTDNGDRDNAFWRCHASRHTRRQAQGSASRSSQCPGHADERFDTGRESSNRSAQRPTGCCCDAWYAGNDADTGNHVGASHDGHRYAGRECAAEQSADAVIRIVRF